MKRFICIFLAVLLIFCCVGCDSKTDQTFKHNAKTVCYMDDEGWLTFFSNEYNDNDYNSFLYNAYNLKYKYLDGYDMEVVDYVSGEVVDKVRPDLPYLSCKEEYNTEIVKIDDFFRKKAYKDIITLDDLNELKITYIDKNDLLGLFNKMIKSQPLPDGKYNAISEADIVQEWETNNFQDGWQVGYYVSHGVIMAIHIEFLKEGRYISDDGELLGNDTTKIYECIKNIEASVVNSNNFAVDFETPQYDSVAFDNLKALLASIDAGGDQ